MCLNPKVSCPLLEELLAAAPALQTQTQHSAWRTMRSALQLLCMNASISTDLLCLLLPHCNQGSEAVAEAFSFLWSNQALTPQLLEFVLQQVPEAAKLQDKSGRLPLHLLCRNLTLKVEWLAALLLDFPEAAKQQDKYGCLPLHCLCENKSVNVECLSALLRDLPEAAKLQDNLRGLPLHILCGNHQVNVECLSELLWAFPEAAKLQNMYGRLPLHFLCKNESVNVDLLLQAYLTHVLPSILRPDARGVYPLKVLTLTFGFQKGTVTSQFVLELARAFQSERTTSDHLSSSEKLQVLLQACAQVGW